MSVSGCHVSVTNQDDINSMLDMLGGLHTAFIWQNLSARFFRTSHQPVDRQGDKLPRTPQPCPFCQTCSDRHQHSKCSRAMQAFAKRSRALKALPDG